MKENYVEPIVINTDDLTPPEPSLDMWENRKNANFMYDKESSPICSIVVTAYNRLKKTKYCVECILKYTQGIDYELILLDNGSNDGTLDFFQSVPCKKKSIIHVTKNCGTALPFKYYVGMFKGKYLVNISNDVYVTHNWLSNLLKCIESDPKIGFVVPCSSNVSNLQQIDLKYSDFDEMQIEAKKYNKSDPTKWQERMRIVSIINFASREMLDNVGYPDAAFVHDFAEDDWSIRMRRLGYKLVLCGDTWICHDHDFRNIEDKDVNAFNETLKQGMDVYRKKHYGIEPWDDINNYELTLISYLNSAKFVNKSVKSLSIDVRCGTPVLEVRNKLRARGITDVQSYAFTTQAKYYMDLQTVCSEVNCDRIEFLQDYYLPETFDIIVLGEPINTYKEPIRLLQRLHSFLKNNGILLFKVRNTDDYRSLLRIAGLSMVNDSELPSILPLEELAQCIRIFGVSDYKIIAEEGNLSKNDKETLLDIIKRLNVDIDIEHQIRLYCENFCIQVVK